MTGGYYTRARHLLRPSNKASSAQEIGAATSPTLSAKEAYNREAYKNLLPDYIALSALSGVSFFDIGRINLEERKTFHTDAVLMAESFLPHDSLPYGDSIRPKGVPLTYQTEAGDEKEFKIAAIGSHKNCHFSSQMCVVLHPLENGIRMKSPIFMMSSEYLDLLENYDREHNSDYGKKHIQHLKQSLHRRTHDHLHGLIRDFDEKPKEQFRAFDYAMQHALPLGEKKKLEGFGPFPVMSPEVNEFASEIFVQECWKLRMLYDADVQRDPSLPSLENASTENMKEVTKAMSEWIKTNHSRLENFKEKDVKSSPLYQKLSTTVKDFIAETSAIAEEIFPLQRKNDFLDIAVGTFGENMRNVFPLEFSSIQALKKAFPSCEHFFSKENYFETARSLNGKIKYANQEISIWALTRMYAESLAESSGQGVEKIWEGIAAGDEKKLLDEPAFKAYTLAIQSNDSPHDRAEKISEYIQTIDEAERFSASMYHHLAKRAFRNQNMTTRYMETLETVDLVVQKIRERQKPPIPHPSLQDIRDTIHLGKMIEEDLSPNEQFEQFYKKAILNYVIGDPRKTKNEIVAITAAVETQIFSQKQSETAPILPLHSLRPQIKDRIKIVFTLLQQEPAHAFLGTDVSIYPNRKTSANLASSHWHDRISRADAPNVHTCVIHR